MIYTILNTASSARGFYNTRKQEITLGPGSMMYVDLDDGTVCQLSARGDLMLRPASFERHAPIEPPAPQAVAVPAKPSISVTGHFGIGDNIHQRAVIRALMRENDVWLHTCHFNVYHDLIEQGLKLVMRSTTLHAQAKTIARERQQFVDAKFPMPLKTARQLNIGYPKPLVDQHGSILGAMFSCVGLKMPDQPDFSFPIKAEWRESLEKNWLSKWNTAGKPLMVHRPVVIRREWDGRSRNPDVLVYDRLYKTIRDQYFVVSVADLAAEREWIDGPHQQVDVALHAGELAFHEMAALFAEAKLVFCNAGFAPVLAQAVGTPVVVVYGGRESYRTTQRVGAHLARTLPIDPINPCDCHSAKHACDKRIDESQALAKLNEFLSVRTDNRDTLLFGTFYVDSPDRDNLTDMWRRLHTTLNLDCDFLAVDSQSPVKKFEDWPRYDHKRHRHSYFNFPDNVGHLSRRNVTAGRDGWGRAFCKGLEIACELGYQYAVHIEGDSLFRLKVADVTRQMKAEGIECASVSVEGMKTPNAGWVETGLMFFSTAYLRRSNFIKRYDWPNRRVSPSPERYIQAAILDKDLDRKKFRLMPWRALRADKNQINKDNILSLNLDWITHQHDSSQQDVYRKFVDEALKEVPLEPPRAEHKIMPQSRLLKCNLGCGTNKLNGWENHDSDVDITKRLPWGDASVGYISIEHCVEHVPYKAAIEFFKEAHRVLSPGGVLRVTVPSLEQIAKCDEADYHKFTTKWQQIGATKRGAMHAIIYCHGHETAWNAQLMRDTLYFAGFDDVREYRPGHSEDPALRGVEGHGRVIGEKFNNIESCTHEARKAGQLPVVPSVLTNIDSKIREVALVIGGAECWAADLEQTKRLLNGQRVRYFVVNDQIKTFPEPCVACTLHPDKLNGHIAWLTNRRSAGLPVPEQVWAHRKHAAVTHDTATVEWSGSSGLFAVQVARREGHTRIIGCGIPMTVEGSHFERHQRWSSAIGFRDGWLRCKNEISGCFRSMSGWTREQFGSPDEGWLQQ